MDTMREIIELDAQTVLHIEKRRMTLVYQLQYQMIQFFGCVITVIGLVALKKVHIIIDLLRLPNQCQD